MSEADWGQIGSAIKARRERLAMTQKEAALEAGLSDTTWLTLESGGKVTDRTARKACAALRWPTDAYERLVAGDDPTTFPDTTPPDPLQVRVAAVEAGLAALDARQQALLAAVARLEAELSSRRRA